MGLQEFSRDRHFILFCPPLFLLLLLLTLSNCPQERKKVCLKSAFNRLFIIFSFFYKKVSRARSFLRKITPKSYKVPTVLGYYFSLGVVVKFREKLIAGFKIVCFTFAVFKKSSLQHDVPGGI